MADQEHSECRAEAQEDEAVLGCRMLAVSDQEGPFIEEYGLGLPEGDAVFAPVQAILRLVPLDFSPGMEPA